MEQKAGRKKLSTFFPSWSRPPLVACSRAFWILRWRTRLQWWKLTRNARLRRLYANNRGIKITLGTGTTIHPGWIDTDYRPLTSDVLYLNATKAFPFPANSVDYFHTEHMIEHLPLISAQFILRECYRTLKPGGKVRIATPDIMRLNKLLTDPSDPKTSQYAEFALCNVPPKVEVGTPLTPCMVFNNFVRDWGHQFIYDEATLSALLVRAGFASVGRRDVNQSNDANLVMLELRHIAIGNEANEFETMVLEGTKPT